VATKAKSRTKSRTKSGSSKKSKISSKLIAAIIVGIVAIAGIIIVFSSFASGPPAYQYQYSTNCPKATTNINVKTNQIVTTTGADIVTVPVDPKSDCVKNSAEAMAYRLYYTTYAKDPVYINAKDKVNDSSTFVGLVQKLAGDRINPQLIYPNSQYATPADLSAFVRTMYKNALNRTPSDKEVNDWLSNIKKGNLDRADIATLFAESAEAKVNLSGKFANYIKANPGPVAVTPTAQNQQNARAAEAKQKSDRMKSLNDEIQSLKKTGIQIGDYTSAKVIADQVSADMIESKKLYDGIEDLYLQSKDLSLYATNISSVDIQNTKNTAYEYLKQSWANAVAMGSYTASLKASGANTAGASSSNSSPSRQAVSNAQRQATGCTKALNSITRSSGATCIKKLQQAYGLTPDGVWGPATQAKVCSIRRNCAPSGSGGGAAPPPPVPTVNVAGGNVPASSGRTPSRIPAGGGSAEFPRTNEVGTSMCRAYKNNRIGTYTDYHWTHNSFLVYRKNKRTVNCFFTNRGQFKGYAGPWRSPAWWDYSSTGGYQEVGLY